MSNAWDYLPNAKYIDLVLASVKANPDEWSVAGLSGFDGVAWDAAMDIIRTHEVLADTRDVAREAVISATMGGQRLGKDCSVGCNYFSHCVG